MPADRVRKLRWMCRRGMKELDVLLEQFLERHQKDLSSGRWPELETLLGSEDDLLWDWLQQPSAAPALRYRTVLEQIRSVRK